MYALALEAHLPHGGINSASALRQSQRKRNLGACRAVFTTQGIGRVVVHRSRGHGVGVSRLGARISLMGHPQCGVPAPNGGDERTFLVFRLARMASAVTSTALLLV